VLKTRETVVFFTGYLETGFSCFVHEIEFCLPGRVGFIRPGRENQQCLNNGTEYDSLEEDSGFPKDHQSVVALSPLLMVAL
jgi:hypothetical protein